MEWESIEATKKAEQVAQAEIKQAEQAEIKQAEQAEIKQAEQDAKSAKISLKIAIDTKQQLASKIDEDCTELAKAEETVAKANKMLLAAQTALEKAKTEMSK